MKLKTKLPPKHWLRRRKNVSRAKYTNVFFGLTEEMAIKLQEKAEIEGITESEVVRAALNQFFTSSASKRPKKGYKKMLMNASLLRKSRTVKREQAESLRRLSEETGRHLSEILREALEGYL